MRMTPERHRQIAARLEAQAEADAKKVRELVEWEPGQPILVGHHSEGPMRRAIARVHKLESRRYDALDEAERHRATAEYVERKQSATEAVIVADPDPYKIGDHVTAVFTNSGRIIRFSGVVVARTRNEWKIRADGPLQGSPAGRVFSVPAAMRPRWSTNNRIDGFAPKEG